MARVSRGLVLVADNLFISDAGEEADRVRDPTHVRNLSEAEWRALVGGAGLRIEASEVMDKPIELDSWLARAGCDEEEAATVRGLLAGRIDEGWITLARIAVKAVKA
jgi:hypothetical protein